MYMTVCPFARYAFIILISVAIFAIPLSNLQSLESIKSVEKIVPVYDLLEFDIIYPCLNVLCGVMKIMNPTGTPMLLNIVLF